MGSNDPKIDELLSLSDNELYLRLGREITGEAATPQGAASLVKRGREFISREVDFLRAAVCGPDGPRSAVGSIDQKTLAGSIAGAIVGGSHIDISHVAALCIAVLLLRTGLDTFCGDYNG
ncbi:MAG TPA: hypothetical protein VMB49_08030 [Acidobacteriaceae bacterium]|nr:hypothetical protein [Acidobacteriaceae bacterium]